MIRQFKHFFGSLLLATIFLIQTTTSVAVTINQRHVVDESIPLIAGPTDFSAHLIDESTVLLSWNPELLDGSEVDYFNIWDQHRVIATTTESQWRFENIDRNDHYDFAISAVTTLNEETRRSSRIYYDLPQLDASLPDGYNQTLPPLENLKAEVINEDSVELTWDLPPSYWSWAKPSEYSYAIIVNNTYIDLVDQPRYTYTGLRDSGEVWIGVSALVESVMNSRQPQRVLVDTSKKIGTVSTSVTGFNSVSKLRAEIYSRTAAELFWQVGYADTSHVYVNGKLIARIKEGHSLFIEDLPPGERVKVSVGQGWPYEPGPVYRYLLSYDYPLMHVWLDMPGSKDPKPNTQTPPVTGLRTQSYSKTAAEIFWDRADNPQTLYRVYLNGEFIVETDAISWYFDELTSGTHYSVGIVAIDPTKTNEFGIAERVEADFLTFIGHGDPLENCDVKGLRSAVYSSSSAEVFWNRDAAGTRYDLFLNDEFVTNTDATSWYFSNLVAGSQHRFTISTSNEICDEQSSTVNFSID